MDNFGAVIGLKRKIADLERIIWKLECYESLTPKEREIMDKIRRAKYDTNS